MFPAWSSPTSFRSLQLQFLVALSFSMNALSQTPSPQQESQAVLHYKWCEAHPRRFLAGESVWRQRAMNADIYTNWNGTPYMSSGEAYISEWVPSAHQSRLSLLAEGGISHKTISGFFEGDFLSAGITSNNLQSNSYTLRIGEATEGSSGQPFYYEFGNGMAFRISTKRYTLPDGRPFEGVGLKPDIEIEPSLEDLKSRRAPVLLKALELAGSE